MRLLFVSVLSVAGCAAAPPPKAVEPPAERVDLHLSLRELSPSNLGATAIEGSVEIWDRPGAGPVLHASQALAADCTPRVTLMLDDALVAGARIDLAERADLVIASQCGVEGESRSWQAVGGHIVVSRDGARWKLSIEGARLEPTRGPNHGFGALMAEGCTALDAA